MNKLSVGFLAASVFLVGCKTTPVTDINTFATAAAESQEQVNSLLSEYNDSAVDHSLTLIATTGETLTSKKLEAALAGKLDKQDNLYALVSFNNALTKYVKSLSDLAVAAEQNKVELAVANLHGSLKNLDSNYQSLTGNDPVFNEEKNSAIASMIAALLSAKAEKERNDALKEIIGKADDDIKVMTDAAIVLISSKEFSVGIANQRKLQLVSEINDYNKHKSGMTNEARKAQLIKIYSTYTSKSSAAQNIKTAVKKIELVQKGHSKLLAVFTKDEKPLDELRSTISYLRDLNDRQDALQELFVTCATEVILDDKGQIACKPEEKEDAKES